MRFLFYSHDGLGLGHTRRHIAVASALVEMAPGSSVLLATGADDYIVKPFLLTEVAARMRAVARRAQTRPSVKVSTTELKGGGITLELVKRNVERFGKAKLLFMRRSAVAGRPLEDFENDFAVIFAKADLDRIDKTLPDIGCDFQTIDENVGRLFEIHIEQRFRLRVIERFSGLINSAETPPLQIG